VFSVRHFELNKMTKQVW